MTNTDKFHERFNIDINIEDAKTRFVNRIQNDIIEGYILDMPDNDDRLSIARSVASALGIRYPGQFAHNFVGQNFLDNLLAVETIYNEAPDVQIVEHLIRAALRKCELDIGVTWEEGRFIRTGAKLLDQKLVNDTLSWLRDKGYQTVLNPFRKGLEHFLHSERRPELLSDVVTDMYESLEALAQVVTGRQDKDLSANRELFLSKVEASDAYKTFLRDYIDYANVFRHAAVESKTRPRLAAKEVESFVYLTGVFIRLAM